MPFRASLSALTKGVLLSTPLPEAILRALARRRLTVLAYHRVLPHPGPDYPFDDDCVSATPEEFERELRFLRRHLDVISVPTLLHGLDSGDLPERPAVITFDDGYADNHQVAFPILRSLELSACFLVCTALLGTRTVPWWDSVACCLKRARVNSVPSPFGEGDAPYRTGRSAGADVRRFLARLKREPWCRALERVSALREATEVNPEEHTPQPLFMSWDAARELAAAGMEVGSHTRTHPVLGGLGDSAARRWEIGGSYGDLERELGQPPRAFAYPVGADYALCPEADREIEMAGYRLSFSYVSGVGLFAPGERYRLPRFHAEFGDDFGAFRLGLPRLLLGEPPVTARGFGCARSVLGFLFASGQACEGGWT
jgi:peptidoglycan/xylan/chitin deacetylase (PgdA/CDA1 family)